MTEIFGGIHTVRGALIMREVSVGLMMLGVIREKVVVGDEVWLAEIQITPTKKYKLPDSYAGHRADQLLTSSMDVSEFEEIPL